MTKLKGGITNNKMKETTYNHPEKSQKRTKNNPHSNTELNDGYDDACAGDEEPEEVGFYASER